MRSTDEVITQLQAQVKQLQFNLAQVESEKAILGRQLAEAKLELALRDRSDALSAWEPANGTRH